MTCRHSPGDPSCSSHPHYKDPYYGTQATPDAANYTIEKAERVGTHLVMRVKYPNCYKCSYEGSKVMVFLNVGEMDALHWRRIDPHFRDPRSKVIKGEAPSPAARFPGSDAGWSDAVVYAHGKAK